VTHIIEVKLNSAVNEQVSGRPVVSQRETLFLAVFGCPCCFQKKDYLTKTQLVHQYGVNDEKVTEIEA